MDRMVKCTFNGREIYLNYSVGVMFEVIEKYGDVSTALTYMQEDTKGGFEVTKHLGLLMAQDGELARRYLGHDIGGGKNGKQGTDRLYNAGEDTTGESF